MYASNFLSENIILRSFQLNLFATFLSTHKSNDAKTVAVGRQDGYVFVTTVDFENLSILINFYVRISKNYEQKLIRTRAEGYVPISLSNFFYD